ncbi:MAG: phosphoadenosine phosphosulfate reductase family protein [Bacteroidaceae bacterium]
MLDKACIIADEVASRGVDEVILFHSASGKDSIALLDILAPRFKRVVCVFLYVFKNAEHINRYISYAKKKYPNCEFVQVPHFAVFSYIKYGYMGHWKNPKQKLMNMSGIAEMVKQKLGIQWTFYGFKQSDSLNRRCMLRTYYMEAICEKSHKCYPLSHYKNKDILEYIERNGLITPERYGPGQSSGQNITDIYYLLFLREKYPNDLRKLYAEYPECERILFEHDWNVKHGEDKTIKKNIVVKRKNKK